MHEKHTKRDQTDTISTTAPNAPIAANPTESGEVEPISPLSAPRKGRTASYNTEIQTQGMYPATFLRPSHTDALAF